MRISDEGKTRVAAEGAEDTEAMLLALTPAQERAVRMLVQGGTHTDAAAAAEVARETVSRWATRHPAFRAALNRLRQELAQEQGDRLRATLSSALTTVKDAVEEGDVTAALCMLRLFPPAALAALLAPPSGPTDARTILDGQLARQRSEELRRPAASESACSDSDEEDRQREKRVGIMEHLAALTLASQVPGLEE